MPERSANNSHRTAMPWLRLLGLSPLVAINLGIYAAALLGVALLIALLLTNGCVALLRRWLSEPQRLIATVLIAAIAVGTIDLLLQTLCYEQAQSLQMYLPLLVVVPLLLYQADSTNRPTLPRALFDALLCGSAFAVGLVMVAALRAPLPSEAGIALGLFASGLLLVLANKISPTHVDKSPPGSLPSTPRTRARVTGPVR